MINGNKNLIIKEIFGRAIKNHQEGKTDIAQELYNKVLKIDPNHLGALNNLGAIFGGLGEYQKAKDCYEQVIKIDPNYVDAYFNLGNSFKELKEYHKAKVYYEKVIEINPNHANAHNNLGAVFQILKENQKAKDCYEQAIEIDPNYVVAYINLGNVYKDLGKEQKAKDCYEKAIEIDPNHPVAHNNLNNLFNKIKLLSKIQKSKNINKISFIKKIQNKFFGSDLRLNTNPFISYREVEEELISCLYKLNDKSFKKTNNIFFGKGKHSENFKIFENDYPILKKAEDDLTNIMRQAVKSDIFIEDSFFNILRDADDGGSKWHTHIQNWDYSHNLQNQKYSLTYHVAIGNQKSSKPGVLKFKSPEEGVLPSKGMVMIFPAERSHSAHYNGKVDRIMIGINFYSLI